MSLTVSQSEHFERTLAPAGAHIARCVSLIDLGTQKDEFEGKPKNSRKVRISWELPLELFVFKPENGEQPFMVNREYTMVLGDRSHLMAHLNSWRGRPMTAEELKAFDLKRILGVPCMVNLIHQPSKSNPAKVYEKITAVTPLPKGTTCPPQVNPSVFYEIENGRNDVFKGLPEFLQKMISECIEWNTAAPVDPDPVGGSPEDDIPF